jgi:hypothetical protein
MELGNKKSLHIESFVLNCLNLLFEYDEKKSSKLLNKKRFKKE